MLIRASLYILRAVWGLGLTWVWLNVGQRPVFSCGWNWGLSLPSNALSVMLHSCEHFQLHGQGVSL